MARKPEKKIRVRSKALNEVDETKLALAVWLMAKGIVEDRTSTDDPDPSSTSSTKNTGEEAA